VPLSQGHFLPTTAKNRKTDALPNTVSRTKVWFLRVLNLPDDGKIYVVECRYVLMVGKKRSKVDLRCSLFRETYTWDAFSVYPYGQEKVLLDNMVLVGKAFCGSYPAILLGK
jgi:hypothetical protein